jgi:hypothetical protein
MQPILPMSLPVVSLLMQQGLICSISRPGSG